MGREWGGVLGEGQPASSSPARGYKGALAAKRFSCTLEATDGLSWNLLGAKFGGACPLATPLKSARVNVGNIMNGS